MLEQEESWLLSQEKQKHQAQESMRKAQELHQRYQVLLTNPAFKEILLDGYLGSELIDLREKIDANEIYGKEDIGLRNEYLARIVLKRYLEKIAKNAETAKTTIQILEDQNNADQRGSEPQQPDNGWE